MKRFVPPAILIGALLLTAAGTLLVVSTYRQKKVKHGYDLKHAHIRQLHQQVILFVQYRKYYEAEQLLHRINRVHPGSHGTAKMLAKVFFLQGKLAQAEDILRRLVLTIPEDPAVRNNLGEVMIEKKFYESGIRELLEAEKLSGGARYIQLNLCHAYALLGKFNLAKKYWDAANRQTGDPAVSLLPGEAIVRLPVQYSSGDSQGR